MSRLRALLAAGGLPAVGSKATLTPESNPLPSAAPWPDILPFEIEALPKFPTYALPGRIRSWVESEARATQTPADLAGMLALAVCSAAIARRVVIEPYPGWREPTNLWVVVLLPPASGKSAVFAEAIAPLRELESELIEASRDSVAEAQSARRRLELQLRRLKKLSKHDPEARREARRLAKELAETPEPVLPQLIVDDITTEPLKMMLAEQSGRIASMSTWGGMFDAIAGLSSKGVIALCDVYCAGHSGRNLFVNLASRKGILVERPAITCAYATIPSVVTRLAANAAFRASGLLTRFLYAIPESLIGRREIHPPPVSEDERNAYREVVRALAAIEDGKTLYLTGDARERFRSWQAAIDHMLRAGVFESMRDWGAGLAGATLRLAAVLHCIDNGAAGQVAKSTIAAAIKIAKYLVHHAKAAFNMMQTGERTVADDAQYLLRWIARHDKLEFTKREAQQDCERLFPGDGDIDPALAELTWRGYVRPKPVGPAGAGRPAPQSYEVNPKAHILDC